MVATYENPSQKFTTEEYLEWEEVQQIKYEYLDGQVHAMSGGTVNHGQIAANLILLMGNHLRGSRKCRLLTSDIKVEVQKSKGFIYPDLSVTCDDCDRPTPNKIGVTHLKDELSKSGDRFMFKVVN